MEGILSLVFVSGIILAAFVLGDAFGHDRLRLNIIDECVRRNPEMANSKVKPFCVGEYEALLAKKEANK